MTDMTNSLLATIARSLDRAWLKRIRDHNVSLGKKSVMDAVHQRLRDLDLHDAMRLTPRTIRRGKKTDGQKLLAANDRLDCAYEQISIDHADEMPGDVIVRARQTLAEFRAAAAQ